MSCNSFQYINLSLPWLNLLLIFFSCYCEWNCSLNFSFELFILVYRNTSDYCMLVARQLLNLLTSSGSIFVYSMRFSIFRIISLEAILLLFLSNLDTFYVCIYFGGQIALARICSTMWNLSGESNHPSLALFLRRRPFSLSLLSVMLVVDFS